jgi:hypothetical protein
MPELRHDCVGYLRAFHVLSDSRLCIQGSYQPIQISEAGAYLTTFLGISGGEERTKALRIFQQMDTIYLKRKADQQEQQ